MNPDDVVLVALVNTPRDLELAETERWYRMPARHAPRHFSGAQYLAFYLPASFGDRKWSIDTYAPVRGHELVRRVDLFPAEPDHARANELYYRLALGPTERREPPIRCKRGRRALFLWTNWEKFSAARQWNDLYLRTPAHEKLWNSLRAENLDVEREMSVREGRSRYRVDFMIYLGSRHLAINLGDRSAREPLGSGGMALTVTPDDIENHFARVQQTIRRATRELQEAPPARA